MGAASVSPSLNDLFNARRGAARNSLDHVAQPRLREWSGVVIAWLCGRPTGDGGRPKVLKIQARGDADSRILATGGHWPSMADAAAVAVQCRLIGMDPTNPAGRFPNIRREAVIDPTQRATVSLELK